jgi:lipopolysaccharide export system protein LptA
MNKAAIFSAACVAVSLMFGVAQAAGPTATPTPQAKKRGVSPILPGGDSKAPITVDAEKLEYFDRDQKLVYTGNVFVQQGDSTMRATVMTVFLTKDEGLAAAQQAVQSDSSGRIRRIESKGPVTVTQLDQVGTGDNGVYDKIENKVYLFGNVVLSRGTNVTKGDRDSKLVYDLDTGYAQVLGGRVNSIFTPGSSEDNKSTSAKGAERKPAR